MRLGVGQTSNLSVSVVLRSGARVEIPLGAAFASDAPAVASVAADGTVTAHAAGTANAWAWVMLLRTPSCAVEVSAQAPEARGAWVTRWDYRSQASIAPILDTLKAAGFNQVYWQVRGRADAFYRSTLEPWGSELTGTLGQDPGFDPLDVAIEHAHAIGLELHAWVNTFPAWTAGSTPPETNPPHVVRAHPDWLQVDGSGRPASSGYLSLSPGHPLVREHIQAVLTEISAYDIDGLHLDYVRYSGAEMSHDAASETAYAAARVSQPGLTYGDFQRDAVADMVRRAREALSTHHPQRPLSAAVWFVHDNTWGWSSVSEGNTAYYQDTGRWLAAGSVDVIIPMLYFPLTSPPGGRLDFLTLVEDHAARAAAHGRVMYAGFESDQPLAEIVAEIGVARTHGAWGVVAFAYSTLTSRGHFTGLAAGPFAQPAPVPLLPWLLP
jgi:uncharacterized lipoprotein YddW (UPF0748 family)